MPPPRDAEPTWIAADKNPFGLRIVDCRPFTRNATSSTSNAEVAGQFATSRNSDGEQHRGRMPERSVAIPCRLAYKPQVSTHAGALFRAKEMEDKWDIDAFDDTLYFSRSWTGELAMTAKMSRASGVLTISAVSAVGMGAKDGVMVTRDVDFLVKTYLFHREMPHSLPAGLPATELSIMTYSFSIFGTAAAFATYGDTTQLTI